jgi:hypothetical protein
MKDEDGGPAFPAEVDGKNGYVQVGPNTYRMPGMSLRTYVAAQALAGLAANPKNDEMIRGIAHWPTTAAAWAFRVADAFLDEQAKGRK